MLLSEYFAEIVRLIEEYSRTNLIVSSDFSNDLRTEKVGIIKGNVVFVDESKLCFTEYVDVTYRVEKLAYSYHYQKQNGELIFRYDNAAHKPPLAFKDHKHFSDKTIVSSDPPDLQVVFDEVIDCVL